MVEWAYFVKVLVALIAIANPVGAIPTFIGLTQDQTPRERKRAARIAAMSATIVLVIAAFAGESVLRFFGVSLSAFRVGGGILLLLTAIAMFRAQRPPERQTPEEAEDARARAAVGAVPLGTPLIAGPGAITTAIIYAHRAPSLTGSALLFAAVALVGTATWVLLRAADPIAKALGTIGINIASRVMGLLLAAIAVEFITSGLRELLPGFDLAR
jgi:multiple antibiotic resistance protein